ncbi:Cytochrome P450, E-class, group I [Parasponia andersonii]|uniref:Cytochrome P450, E-class, group I n=1 Tax=Parasponia andersonii TaxID=3476 RepID=A0A2P5DY38_PARAD|nr:Cytochrome P450, E-class, group I [Parasponia andersonii]
MESSASPLCGALATLLSVLFPSRSNACANSDESPRVLLKDLVTREFNAFLWISLIAITVLLVRKVFKLLRLWSMASRIPGPPSPSFYGHCKLISSENLTDFLSNSHEKYGSVVRLWLSPTQLLVSIKAPNLIKEMLFKAADKLPLTGRAFSLAFGRSSLFASSFDEVQKRRETLMAELSERLLKRANVIPGRIVECIMERIHGSMAKGSVDCKTVSQHMAFTILGTTLFGDAFLAWSKANVYEEILMMIAKDACFWASYNVTPFWKRGFWKYQRLCTKLKCLTQDIVQQCRKNYKLFHGMDHHFNERAHTGNHATYAGSSCSDGVMPDNFFCQEFKNHFDEREEEPSGNIMGMMFHGCLTTTGLINNILMRLVMHQEIQEKIYNEINLAQKDSITPVEQKVDRMLLLLATVYESARLLPAGPLLQRCSLERDLSLENGVTIPAGAVLVVPVQLVQKDGSSWGSDANEFNPYRFLLKIGKRSDLVLNTSFSEKAADLGESSFVLNDPNNNAAFLPFGSGVRACVGQKFVIQGVAALFASLLKNYKIRLQPETQITRIPNMNCGFQLLPSTEIVFVRRNI